MALGGAPEACGTCGGYFRAAVVVAGGEGGEVVVVENHAAVAGYEGEAQRGILGGDAARYVGDVVALAHVGEDACVYGLQARIKQLGLELLLAAVLKHHHRAGKRPAQGEHRQQHAGVEVNPASRSHSLSVLRCCGRRERFFPAGV